MTNPEQMAKYLDELIAAGAGAEQQGEEPEPGVACVQLNFVNGAMSGSVRKSPFAGAYVITSVATRLKNPADPSSGVAFLADSTFFADSVVSVVVPSPTPEPSRIVQ